MNFFKHQKQTIMKKSMNRKVRLQNQLNRAKRIIWRYKQMYEPDVPNTKLFMRPYTLIVLGREFKTCIQDEFQISLKYFRKILGWNIKKKQEAIDRM